jgi:hypothetical protein
MTKAELEQYAADQIAANHVLQQLLAEGRQVAREISALVLEMMQ